MSVIFDGSSTEPTDLRGVIGQAVGAATVGCWTEGARGVFIESRANEIVDEVVAWIEGQPPQQLVVYEVADREQGVVNVELDDGKGYTEPVIVLTLGVLRGTDKTQLALVVPKSSGPELLQNLLTPEQYETLVSGGY